MPTEYISPRQIAVVTKRGFQRVEKYHKAQAMFVKAYVGQYYAQEKGLTGQQPINLIYAAIRSLIPNLIMQNPINKATTQIIPHRPYAELLSLGLNFTQEQLKLHKILRGWIVDAILGGLGIVETGLAQGDNLVSFGDINIDPGQLYSQLVSLSDFTFDPVCTRLEEATFIGRRIRVPRQILLDDDETDSELVLKIPSAVSSTKDKDKLSSLSKSLMQQQEMHQLQDYVNVVKLWIPKANASILIPDPYQLTLDKYIKITDYYGPKTGPYTFLSLSQPVTDNPISVAPASIWYDLHNMANSIFTKAMEQAEAQKNIVFYDPAHSEEMEEAMEAANNGVVASSDPSAFNSVSFGGASPENEFMVKQLQSWFNYMAGNPDQMSGTQSPGGRQGKQSATLSQILQSNASIVTEDYRNIIYNQTAEISRNHAWYLHTDPLIDLLLAKRQPGKEDAQVELTPEQRQGDFINFTFKIVPKSMSHLDPMTRAKRIMEFSTNVIPAAVAAGMQMIQLGQPFNIQKYLTRMGEELEIGEWVQDLFYDPEFEQKIAIMMALGPQNAGKGQVITPEAIQQNGGYPLQRNVASQETEQRQQSQETAGQAQSQNMGVY